MASSKQSVPAAGTCKMFGTRRQFVSVVFRLFVSKFVCLFFVCGGGAFHNKCAEKKLRHAKT